MKLFKSDRGHVLAMIKRDNEKPFHERARSGSRQAAIRAEADRLTEGFQLSRGFVRGLISDFRVPDWQKSKLWKPSNSVSRCCNSKCRLANTTSFGKLLLCVCVLCVCVCCVCVCVCVLCVCVCVCVLCVCVVCVCVCVCVVCVCVLCVCVCVLCVCVVCMCLCMCVCVCCVRCVCVCVCVVCMCCVYVFVYVRACVCVVCVFLCILIGYGLYSSLEWEFRF